MPLVRFALACTAAALLAGCPGTLDPDEFADCPPGFVEGAVFEATCATAGCHTTAAAAAGLDLESPDPAARMIDVAATANCGSAPLIDSAAPLSSVLLDKVSDAPSCGDPMPPDMPLSAREMSCLRRWVQDAVASP